MVDQVVKKGDKGSFCYYVLENMVSEIGKLLGSMVRMVPFVEVEEAPCVEEGEVMDRPEEGHETNANRREDGEDGNVMIGVVVDRAAHKRGVEKNEEAKEDQLLLGPGQTCPGAAVDVAGFGPRCAAVEIRSRLVFTLGLFFDVDVDVVGGVVVERLFGLVVVWIIGAAVGVAAFKGDAPGTPMRGVHHGEGVEGNHMHIDGHRDDSNRLKSMGLLRRMKE